MERSGIGNVTCDMGRVRISNLGWLVLASKVPSDTQYLNSWWINLAKVLMRFVTWVRVKVYQISDKLIHHGLRYGVSEGTYEAKEDQPKLNILTMVTTHTVIDIKA